MMRSMMSAISGLRAQQTAMDVIGNNISNVNTAGFKASNINFTDLFYQTLEQGSASVNPMQVGYGSQVGSVDKDMSSTGATSTDNPLDLYIDGEGFFAINTKLDGSGTTYYTRLGNFHINSAGYLVDSSGNYVLGAKGSGVNTAVGAPVCLMGTTFHSTTGTTIKVDSNTYKQLSNIQINKDGTISASLDDQVGILSNDTVSATPVANTTFIPTTSTNANIPSSSYTSLGNITVSSDGSVSATTTATPPDAGIIIKNNDMIGGTFVPDNATQGMVQITSANAADVSFTANADGTVTATYTNGSVTSQGTLLGPDGKPFNVIGQVYRDGTAAPVTITAATAANYTYALTTGGGITATDVAAPHTAHTLLGAQLNMFGMTYQSSDGITGQAMGPANFNKFTGLKFGNDGSVTVSYDCVTGTMDSINSQDLRLALAMFVNPNGLNEVGNSCYVAGVSSGDPSYIGAGDGNSTVIRSNELEMSNVDLAKEFTNMIVTQRGYQANSRVITVSDSLLEELVNLKRS